MPAQVVQGQLVLVPLPGPGLEGDMVEGKLQQEYTGTLMALLLALT